MNRDHRIGIFPARVAARSIKLALRAQRPQYLIYGPRAWRLLEDVLAHPTAAPLPVALHRRSAPAACRDLLGPRT